jgi:hypothetical protein
MVTNPIARQLRDARDDVERLSDEISRLSRELDVSKARLDAFEIASRAFEAMPLVKGGAAETSRHQRETKTRNRLPNADWRAVFGSLYRNYQEGFGYEDIMTVATVLGIDVQKASLRTKMMNYVNDGYAERVTGGRFAITPTGYNYFQISGADDARNENGEAEASPDADEVTASSDQ